jgi:type I restriction enzyme S subunit
VAGGALNHHLEQMALTIFKSWFVDFEPFGGKMPTNWTIGTVSDISADVVCGKTPPIKVAEYYGEDVLFITIPDMHGVVYITSTERSLSKAGAASQRSKMVPPNSVCVSCIATAGLVGLTSVPSQTNQQINTIISPYFVYLNMVRMADHIKMLGSSGSATNNLNKGQFSKIELIIPENSDMSEFSALVEPLFETIKRNQQENALLAETRDALLPRLMSGELSVADLGKDLSPLGDK